MKIRAAVLRRSGLPYPFIETKPLTLETVELDPPGPGEVLVRIAAAGICHSDLSVVEGVRPRPLPMVTGHESAGIVEEVGPQVEDLRPGDHVVSVFVPMCGHCLPCAEGRPALCEPGGRSNVNGTLLSGARRLHCESVPLSHQTGVSCFAEYAVMSRHSLVKVEADLPLEEAALFGCAVLTGVGAVFNSARVRPGGTVAVIGLGGVGLAGVMGAVAAGAGRIIAIDTNEQKLAVAKTFGATDVFNAADEHVVQAVRDATQGGVDTVVELAGAVAALELGYQIARRGGELVTAGLPPPQARFAIPAVTLTGEERTIRGSYMGSAVPIRDLPRYIGLYRRGLLPVDRLVTHRMALADINLGMDRLHQGQAIRQLITSF
jgi:alcohol dehydrogenase